MPRRAGTGQGFSALRDLSTGASSLSKRELGVLVRSTAATLRDSYCALASGKRLAAESDAATAAEILSGGREGLEARDQA